MHWVGYAELAAAVSNAGGLGRVSFPNESGTGSVLDLLSAS